MPLNDPNAQMLLAAGAGLIAVNRVALHAKHTPIYKLTYFLSWPVAGTGVLFAVQPDPEKFRHKLEQEGHL
jgi:hypothetical protein